MRALGPYTLLHLLGAGGMGEVWAARRDALGGASRLVAIKTLLPSKVSDPIARRMFFEEARVSMLLRNSNIVQVHDAAEAADGTCYLVMELVDGIDLAKLSERLYARGQRLPLVVITYIIGELLKALAYAHEFMHDGTRRTVVHRDISPHNVMLSASGEVKLMDFGVARLASEETTGNFVKGKVRYMPPEQLEGESRQPSVDLFALGAVLHELLDARKFRGASLDEGRLIGMVARGEVPPLVRGPQPLPPEIERLRVGLLAARPEHRIGGARAAHRLLSDWSGYRDARFELEAIVQAYASPHQLDPLGSGPVVVGPPEEDPPGPLPQATMLVVGDDAPTRPITAAGSSDKTRERVEVAKPRSTPRFAWLAVGGLGLALAGIGLSGVDLGSSEQRGSLAAPSDPATSLADEGVPPPSPPEDLSFATAPSPPTAPTLDTEPLGGAAPVTTTKVEPPAEPSPAQPEQAPNRPVDEPPRVKSKPKPKPKTKVRVTTKDGWVQVRIDGRGEGFELAQKKSASRDIELSPGVHDFEILIDSEWTSAGQLKIPVESATVVIKDGRARVE